MGFNLLGAIPGLGNVAAGITGLIGGSDAEDAQQEGYNNAKGQVNSSYGQAEGLYQPVESTALGAYSNLASNYASGQYQNPSMSFDPTQIGSDPEYQALLKQGQNAITGSAESQGGLFSGNTDRALQNYGEQTAATQEGQLFNQDLGQNEFNASNNATNFNEGEGVASELNPSMSGLGSLYTEQGSDLGNLDIGQENARANSILNQTGIGEALGENIGNTLGGALGGGGDSSGSGGSGGFSSMGSLYGGLDPETLMQLYGGGAALA